VSVTIIDGTLTSVSNDTLNIAVAAPMPRARVATTARE
jgi:hypothetical protein